MRKPLRPRLNLHFLSKTPHPSQKIWRRVSNLWTFHLSRMIFLEILGTPRDTHAKRGPPVPITPLDLLDKEILKENINELTTIMSSEWVEKVEHSSREI
jgi:hypothetical protein